MVSRYCTDISDISGFCVIWVIWATVIRRLLTRCHHQSGKVPATHGLKDRLRTTPRRKVDQLDLKITMDVNRCLFLRKKCDDEKKHGNSVWCSENVRVMIMLFMWWGLCIIMWLPWNQLQPTAEYHGNCSEFCPPYKSLQALLQSSPSFAQTQRPFSQFSPLLWWSSG